MKDREIRYFLLLKLRPPETIYEIEKRRSGPTVCLSAASVFRGCPRVYRCAFAAAVSIHSGFGAWKFDSDDDDAEISSQGGLK